VIDLVAVLQQSLAENKGGKKKSAAKHTTKQRHKKAA
jgi:non-homologous end joining protein Ku